MEKTMTPESLVRKIALNLRAWEEDYSNEASYTKTFLNPSISLINQFKESICRDVARKAWIQAVRKHHEPLAEDGFSSFIEDYLKSNP